MTAKLSAAALLAVLALSACEPMAPVSAAPGGPAPVGQPATQAPADRLLAAIESQGCLLTRGNVEAVLLRANLTQAELVTLTDQLNAQGRAEVSGEGTIRVLTDNCI
jgi:hypothetical protein